MTQTPESLSGLPPLPTSRSNAPPADDAPEDELVATAATARLAVEVRLLRVELVRLGWWALIVMVFGFLLVGAIVAVR